jgi:hypothetical protein
MIVGKRIGQIHASERVPWLRPTLILVDIKWRENVSRRRDYDVFIMPAHHELEIKQLREEWRQLACGRGSAHEQQLLFGEYGVTTASLQDRVLLAVHGELDD